MSLYPNPLLSPAQKTLAQSVSCTGFGAHGGKQVTMTLHPASAGSGIVFERTDLSPWYNTLPARWDYVRVTPLCTQLVNEAGVEVRTIEHVMAALYASGIDNAHIALNGDEVPLMDGAAAFFMDLFEEAGVEALCAPRRFLKVSQALDVREGAAFARLEPAASPAFQITVAYPQHGIAPQSHGFDFGAQNFRDELAACRTFGFEPEIHALREKSLTLGCDLDNAILVSGEGAVMNPEGLRYPNELARHKLLDAIGDLSLAGGVILGRFSGNRSGHAMNNALLCKLFATRDAVQEMHPALPASFRATRHETHVSA